MVKMRKRETTWSRLLDTGSASRIGHKIIWADKINRAQNQTRAGLKNKPA